MGLRLTSKLQRIKCLCNQVSESFLDNKFANSSTPKIFWKHVMDAKANIQPIVCIQLSIVLTRYIIGYPPSLPLSDRLSLATCQVQKT